MKKLLSAAILCGLFPLAVVAAEPAALLEVRDAWVRALPPNQPNTAAYLTVTNNGAAEVIIVGASTAIAERVEIHTVREVDGLQRMERLPRLRVEPGRSVELAPGGTHLMLLGLGQMPAPGQEVRLCLRLEHGSDVCTTAGVRKSEGDARAHEHHQH